MRILLVLCDRPEPGGDGINDLLIGRPYSVPLKEHL